MKVGIWGNTEKESFWKLFPELGKWLVERNHEIFVTTLIQKKISSPLDFQLGTIKKGDDFKKLDFLLAMGGDGTILSAARRVYHHDTPILGVHLGGFGFLAEVTINNLYSRLEQVFLGKYSTFPRMVLEGEIRGESIQTVYCINDFVLDRGENFRLIKCSLRSNDKFVTTYVADGLIISTPTGSTAYNLSAGGPIVAPWLSLITVTPICPHTLSARPIVLPAEETLLVSLSRGDKARLTIDGQEVYLLKSTDKIRIRKANFTISTIMFEDSDYFETLRRKLGLGQE